MLINYFIMGEMHPSWVNQISTTIREHFKTEEKEVWSAPDRENIIEDYTESVIIFLKKLKGEYNIDEYQLILQMILNSE